MDIEQALLDFVKSEILLGDESESIGLDDSLFVSGIVDSLDFMKLLLYIDENYGVRTIGSESNPEQFETVRKIADYIRRHSTQDKK